jgi:hypothetical protein
MTECKQFLYNERYLHQLTLLIASPVTKWSLKDRYRKIMRDFRLNLSLTVSENNRVVLCRRVRNTLIYPKWQFALIMFLIKQCMILSFRTCSSHLFLMDLITLNYLEKVQIIQLSLCVFSQLPVFQKFSIIFFIKPH